MSSICPIPQSFEAIFGAFFGGVDLASATRGRRFSILLMFKGDHRSGHLFFGPFFPKEDDSCRSDFAFSLTGTTINADTVLNFNVDNIELIELNEALD